MKVFLDTNVLIRFYVKDVQKQYEDSKLFIERIEEGEHKAYTSGIVFLEISFVLKNIYKIPFAGIVEILDSIQSVRGITILDKTDSQLALDFYRKYRVKFSDCLIASQIPKDMILVTFDEEFRKIKEIVSKSPSEIV